MRALPDNRIVFPLDVPTLADARTWLETLRDEVGVFKVGLELFVTAGVDAIRAVHDAGAACFLDLKIHDISETMRRAVEAAVRHEVAYLTLHASSGTAGLSRAAEVARGSQTQLLAVTVLTSLAPEDLSALGVDGTPAVVASRWGKLAREAGLDGFVCSPHECEALRTTLGAHVQLVVPGVRPSGADEGDQKRVATPAMAIARGADLLVVGRPIRDASNPVESARAIAREIRDALPVADPSGAGSGDEHGRPSRPV